MYLFFENGMRGGVSYISEDIAKPPISISNLMTQHKNQNIYTWTKIIYMVM